MFADWENFYIIVGSSAGALIGLMFVVVTLTAGRDRAETERGKHVYTSPIVWHLGVVLTLSATATVPTISAPVFAFAAGALALIGIAVGLRNAVAIARHPGDPTSPGFDIFWYGIAPALVYAGLAVSALGVLRGWHWGESAVAADLMALLLVSINAEWDLVTYLAPDAGRSPDDKKKRR
jgi:lysylphosphatidylglycerol synthetase-like protein (DUF2156 family)